MSWRRMRNVRGWFLVGVSSTLLALAACGPNGGGDGEDGADDDTGMMDTGTVDTAQPEDTSAGGDTGSEDTADPDDDTFVSDGGTEEDADGGSGGFQFRTAGPGDFQQTDRMGMPAVSTALVPKNKKNAYNQGTPQDDVNMTFASAAVSTLKSIHQWFDPDLKSLGLTPCTEVDANGDGTMDVKDCLTQTVGMGGPSLQSLVIPDTLTLDTSKSAGFPNGRKLSDPVMDVTLAVILLDLGSHGPTTFASMPLNPKQNDVGNGKFRSSFPYLHPPHTP